MASRGRGGNSSAVGMMEGAFFVSRTELIEWVNKLLQINLTKVEQCASGAVYCQIIHSLHPESFSMKKVNWMAKADHEYIPNYKVLQGAFDRIGIQKHIDVDKLIRAKYQDNLEFLQWMKCYWDREGGAAEYDASFMREGKPTPPWAQAIGGPLACAPRGAAVRGGTAGAAVAATRPQTGHKENVRPSFASLGAKPKSETQVRSDAAIKVVARAASPLVEEHAKGVPPNAAEDLRLQLTAANGELADLQFTLQGLEKERDYYFRKLRDVELLCTKNKENTDDPRGFVNRFAEEVLGILYAENDEEFDGDVDSRSP